MNSFLATPILAAEGGTEMLMPDGSLLVIIVLFLALVPILNRVLFKPISDVLDERERLTGGSNTDVRAMFADVDYKLAGYEEGIRDARAAGYRVIEQRRAEGLDRRQKAVAAARQSAESRVAEARAAIAADAAVARERLESDAREIATTISSTVLGRAVGGGR